MNFKKVLIGGLCFALVFGALVGCNKGKNTATETTAPTTETTAPTQAKGPYEAGKVENNVYINKFFGVKYTLPSNFTVTKDEVIKEAAKKGSDMMYDANKANEIKKASANNNYELVAVSDTGKENIIIMSEDVKISIETDAFINLVKQGIAQSKAKPQFQDLKDREVGGITFRDLTYNMEVNGVKLNQTLLFKMDGTRVFMITVTYANEGDLGNILAGLSAL